MTKDRTTALIGKAALHLACFHLARMGHDFTITRENSKTGDLWADFGTGIEVVEVKGMTAGAWQLRAEQLRRVARVMFVTVDDGSCWLVQAADVLAAMGERERTTLTPRQLRSLPAVEMHRRIGRVVPYQRPQRLPFDPAGKGNRTVKKILADGTVKVYRYGPHAG